MSAVSRGETGIAWYHKEKMMEPFGMDFVRVVEDEDLDNDDDN